MIRTPLLLSIFNSSTLISLVPRFLSVIELASRSFATSSVPGTCSLGRFTTLKQLARGTRDQARLLLPAEALPASRHLGRRPVE